MKFGILQFFSWPERRVALPTVYQRALQGPGAPAFTLLFSDATGAQLKSTVLPRLNVIRIR